MEWGSKEVLFPHSSGIALKLVSQLANKLFSCFSVPLRVTPQSTSPDHVNRRAFALEHSKPVAMTNQVRLEERDLFKYRCNYAVSTLADISQGGRDLIILPLGEAELLNQRNDVMLALYRQSGDIRQDAIVQLLGCG